MQIAKTLHDRAIRCILFDLGDTLWTGATAEVWEAAIAVVGDNALTILSQYIASDVLQARVGDNPGTVLYRLILKKRRVYHLQHPGHEPGIVQNVQEALSEMGLPVLEAEICQALHEALHIPIGETRLLFDDVFPTLDALRQRGYLLGVVTNRAWGGPLFLDGLRKLGLLDYFDPAAIAISEDLGLLKPHPDIFRYALDALGAAPEETIMVGDSLRADVAGARSLNMLAVWKPRLRLRAAAHASGAALDDSALYNYVVAHEKYELVKKHPLYPPVRPDLTIEHVGDLLAFLPKVGGS